MKTSIKIKNLIRKNNAIWQKATTMEKRILVAKDVLAQLRNEKVVAAEHQWVEPLFGQALGQARHSLQECLYDNNAPTCLCCAVGALMLSTIRYANNVTLTENHAAASISLVVPHNYNYCDTDIIDKQVSAQLRKVFDHKTIRNIESCFEYNYGAYISEMAMPEEWVDSSANHRMIEIMKNIIKNNGQFKMKQLLSEYK